MLWCVHRRCVLTLVDPVAPGNGLCLQIANVRETATSHEIIADIMHQPLDFALGLWPLRAANLRNKAHLRRKVQKLFLPDGFAMVDRLQHSFHPVGQNGLQYTAEILEGMNHAVQQTPDIAAPAELDIARAAEAQYHDKASHLHDLIVKVQEFQNTPVHLRLLPRFGFIAFDGRTGFDGGQALGFDVVLEKAHFAAIALLFYLAEDHLAIVDSLLHKLVDLAFEGIQLGCFFPPLLL